MIKRYDISPWPIAEPQNQPSREPQNQESVDTPLPGAGAAAPKPRPCVIFVHGIFSSHESFTLLRTYLSTQMPDWDFYFYDYDYNSALVENGAAFAWALRRFADAEAKGEINVVAHSMGGLVSRLAICSGSAPPIKKLFLLGTPNFGALRTSQLGLAAQVVRRTSGLIFGLFLRKPGIHDLTHVYDIFNSVERDETAAAATDYISIPGCYFHEARDTLHKTRGDVWSKVFASIDTGFTLTKALGPLLRIDMKRPHDGIVEEVSNSLLPCIPGRWSEKAATINSPDASHTYVHAVLRACEELTHTDIQSNPEVMRITADILLASSVGAWRSSLKGSDYGRLRLAP